MEIKGCFRLTDPSQLRNTPFQKIHWKLWADKKGDGFLDQRVSSDREKMNWAIVADFLEDLKLAGIFAEDDETFGAENLLGEGIQELLEGPLFHKCRERNFTRGEVVFRMVVMVALSVVVVSLGVMVG